MTNQKAKKTTEILEAEVVARHFGFIGSNPESVTKDDTKSVAGICKEKDYLDDNLFPIDEIFAQLRKYKEEGDNDLVEPKLLYYEGSAPGGHRKHRKRTGEEMINLQVINVNNSIAEALLIKTAEAVLSDHGVKKILVKINDLGGKESQSNFIREATSYYRKHINDLSPHCRQLFKEGLHALFKKGKRESIQIHEGAPKPMDFLDEESRKRFSEILEFLETLDIPYEIDQNILGDPNYSTHTVFEIIDQNSGKVLATGSRYDYLARKGGLRKDIPGVGAIIHLPNPKYLTERSLNKVIKSKFYFLQIGYEAKLKSLQVIDQLRKENIAVLHKVYRDRLTAQIAAAKKAGSDYLIIMGQKEALEDELIIRDKESRSQQIVGRNDIVAHLKRLE